MMYTVLFISVLVFSGAFAQFPNKCLTPTEMHYRWSLFDHERDVYIRFTETYDAIKNRTVTFEDDSNVIPGKELMEFLILYEEKVLYAINRKTKACKKSVPPPFRSLDIPANATFDDQFYMGGPSEDLFVSQWTDRVPNRKREHFIGTYSMKNCYPVQHIYIKNDNITDTQILNFYDITNGIPDPDDFIPPAECNTAEWAEFPEEYSFMFH